MLRKVFSVQSLLWLALVLALVGSLRHVAWGFSTLEQGDLVAGYVQAVAVDVGLFSLAIGINQRKRQGRGTIVLWIGVLLFAGLSTYGNLLHGLVFKSDIGLTEWPWLDLARPFALSGVLPLLVVYLSEIVGSDVSYAVQQAEKEAKKKKRATSKTGGKDVMAVSAEHARQAKAKQDELSKAQALNTMLSIYEKDPDAGPTEVGKAIGRSRTTVYTYLDELEEAGRIGRNGDGVEVLTVEHR